MTFPYSTSHLNSLEALKAWLRRINIIEMQTEPDEIAQIQDKSERRIKEDGKEKN